jgi:hypothetical protein
MFRLLDVTYCQKRGSAALILGDIKKGSGNDMYLILAVV